MSRKFFPLLVLVGVACDSPTEVVLPEPEPEPEDVVVTFVMPYPKNAGPVVEGATVVCLEGCPRNQTLTTDSLGSVTFLSVFPPLKVEARKEGYITKQAHNLVGKDSVVLSHVWPEESRGSFRRLQILKETVLHWGRNNLVEYKGVYFCPRLVVKLELPRYDGHLSIWANQGGVPWREEDEGGIRPSTRSRSSSL